MQILLFKEKMRSTTCHFFLPNWFSIFLTLAYASGFRHPRIEVGTNRSFMLGGLFPVHQKGPSADEPCGPILTEKGIQRLEAMLYAMDVFNKEAAGTNFTLGATIVDTCSSDAFALEQSLLFLQSSCSSTDTKKKVVGVVGAANSAVSESVANIFRLFKIPQVSYASTSEELDNLYKYPYFFRVVPSDRFQVKVIFDILLYFKWTYVQAVASQGDYGEKAIKNLQELVSKSTHDETCFADVYIIPRNSTDEDYRKTVNLLTQHDRARVVIVFLNEDKVRKLLTAVRDSRASYDKFIWLASDGWGTKFHVVEGNEGIAEGAISILPKRYPIKAGFDGYFMSLKPETNRRNPWFKEFWEAKFNCSFNRLGGKRICNGKESLKEVYSQEGLVPMVIDSVRLFYLQIKSLCRKEKLLCKSVNEREMQFRKMLKDYIAIAEFNSSQGHNMKVSFDSRRSIPVHYKIYQFRRESSSFEYVEIGEWTPTNETRLRMQEGIQWNGNDFVHSTCSDECGAGQERILNRNPKKRCCWTCRHCDDGYFLPDIRGHCKACPEGQISKLPDRISCEELELDYVGKNLTSPWALIPLVFSILGLLNTLIVFIIFFLNRNTPVIMASGRELCYIIFVGISLCYCYSFVALAKPSVISCGSLRTGMGLGLAICYSAIFTKTNRISRIFNRSLRVAKRPAYISPESQIVICACLILIQLVLTAMWLIVKPPAVKHKMLQNPPAWVSICGLDGTSVILGLSYNMILVILCTIYAYKTRNMPENFNESKYISFTMYASCIVWLAFLPIYCSAWQDYKVQNTVLCMSVSVSGTVKLACLFLPKIYIVVFRPEKNVRYPNSTTNSASGISGNNTPVRFVRSAVTLHTPSTPKKNINQDVQKTLIISNTCVTSPDSNG